MNRRTLMFGAAAGVAGLGAIGFSIAETGSADAYNEAMARMRAPLAGGGDRTELVRLASLAANGHNTQPWRFKLGEESIRIAPDIARRTPVVDPDDHHLYVSLGCAAENLAQAGAASGLPGDIAFDPAGDGAIVFTHTNMEPRPSAL